MGNSSSFPPLSQLLTYFGWLTVTSGDFLGFSKLNHCFTNFCAVIQIEVGFCWGAYWVGNPGPAQHATGGPIYWTISIMIDPESESCGWPVGFCKRGRSMIGTSISPWQWSHTLVTWFCLTVVMNDLLLSMYCMFRAFITFITCQICKCLNNDLLWGTSWRLQAAKLQWKPQLWDLWSGWGAVYCTLFVDGWTILVCWKVFGGFFEGFWRLQAAKL